MLVSDIELALDHGSLCVGSGLVTLDIVVDEESPDECVVRSGGSCGNVLTILSYLGWKSYPISRLGFDEAATLVLSDLMRFGVDIRFMRRENAKSTPSIIEGIRKTKTGRRTHSFKLYCPNCNKFLMTYRTISREMSEQALGEIDRPEVFYFDRTSRGILRLAQSYRERGALIVFEPSGIGNEKLFCEAVELCHVLKYSNERLTNSTRALSRINVPLEIQTLGREGLRYRWHRNAETMDAWIFMPAFENDSVADEAGAGDWCTAGIIHSLGRQGVRSFWSSCTADIEKALQLGQAMASISCRFASARGVMYAKSPSEFRALVQKLPECDLTCGKPESFQREAFLDLLAKICSGCSKLDDARVDYAIEDQISNRSRTDI